MNGYVEKQDVWQAAFASNASFCVDTKTAMLEIVAWASMSGMPSTPDLQKQQAHELPQLGLVGQEFTDLLQLFAIGAQHTGAGSTVEEAHRVLAHAAAFFSTWSTGFPSGAANAPAGAQPTANDVNPLESLSTTEAQQQVQSWMSEMHATYVRLRRDVFRNKTFHEPFWRLAMQGSEMYNFSAEVKQRMNWIADWAAPNGVWDRSKLQTEKMVSTYQLRSLPFINTKSLFTAGAAIADWPIVCEANAALERAKAFKY